MGVPGIVKSLGKRAEPQRFELKHQVDGKQQADSDDGIAVGGKKRVFTGDITFPARTSGLNASVMASSSWLRLLGRNIHDIPPHRDAEYDFTGTDRDHLKPLLQHAEQLNPSFANLQAQIRIRSDEEPAKHQHGDHRQDPLNGKHIWKIPELLPEPFVITAEGTDRINPGFECEPRQFEDEGNPARERHGEGSDQPTRPVRPLRRLPDKPCGQDPEHDADAARHPTVAELGWRLIAAREPPAGRAPPPAYPLARKIVRSARTMTAITASNSPANRCNQRRCRRVLIELEPEGTITFRANVGWIRRLNGR